MSIAQMSQQFKEESSISRAKKIGRYVEVIGSTGQKAKLMTDHSSFQLSVDLSIVNPITEQTTLEAVENLKKSLM